MKKVKILVETEKQGLFGKKKVIEEKIVKVDDKTYRRLMKEKDPFSFDEMMIYDDLFDD